MNVGETLAKPVRPWRIILFGLVFVMIGLSLIAMSFVTLRLYNEKNETYKAVSGTVVGYKIGTEGQQAIVAEYVVNGNTYQKESSTFSANPRSIGSEVKLKYNPKKPSEAIWAKDENNMIIPFVGVLFTIIGAMVLIIGPKPNLLGEPDESIDKEPEIAIDDDPIVQKLSQRHVGIPNFKQQEKVSEQESESSN